MSQKKLIIVIIFIIIALGSWLFAYKIYKDNQSEIILGLEKIIREIALPFRIVEMNFKERVTELPVPVYGVTLREIADTWGQAREGGRSHEGVDIFAERNTPVFSATEGYVTRKNFGTIGGLNVFITGPGGVRYYYAHLESIADGIEDREYVTHDTVIGYVGNSGNASGTPPHLHFGVYERPWGATNPYPMLIDRW